MEQMGYIIQDPAVLAVIAAVSMLLGWRIGVRLGRGERVIKGPAPQFDGASLALLGLLLAFAFGTSMSKYDQRRIAVIQDIMQLAISILARRCSRSQSGANCRPSYETTQNSGLNWLATKVQR